MNNKLYVGNLAYSVRDSDLEQQFAEFGSVSSAKVMMERDTGRYLSEDYAFCRRWQALGGKVHVDTRSRLAHQGLQTWQGDLPRALLARHGG